ncbi:MAG TPA: type 4a pilus biogenesis protein PilO [Candidatus Saccharimonadales bacterium]|nr:type 4a pilus biogenesis protein PilO [Candidatus Saccharimonadales bacterium]
MKRPVAKVLNLNLGKREKIQQANSTILVVVVIASIVMSFALVMGNFLLKQKSYNDHVYKEKKIARDTLKQNVINAKGLEDKFKDIEDPKSLANSQTILDALPGDYDNPALRTSIESLVKRNSLSIESLTSVDQEGQVAEKAVDPKPVEMPFTVTVEGDYGKVRNFISDLEHTIRPMKVTALTLNGSDQDMKAEISVVTYFQPTREIGITTKEVK